MAEDKTGILLLNLGGPDSVEAVRPFLFNLFSDREIIRLGPPFLQRPIAMLIALTRSKKTIGYYRLIGGGSPILDITFAQSKALEDEVRRKGEDYRFYVGMRYWHPFIREAVKKAKSDGVEELIALPLYPHYSRATTGSCFGELEKAVAKYGGGMKVRRIKSWHDHLLYIKALGASIEEGLQMFSKGDVKDVTVLFSAHGLPRSFVDEGDPYVDHIKASIDAVSRVVGLGDHRLSFQSRSGPVKWIGPSTEETIQGLANEGVKRLLMVPISFVSDHIETLYEMDILYRKQAEGLGVEFARAPSLNTSPEFIKALADIALSS